MNEAEVIGGMFVAMGLLACGMAFFGHHQLVTRERFWGGVFRGWRTKQQAPILYEFNRISSIVCGLAGLGLASFGLWIMGQ